jgi:hypothetical protein
MDDRVAQIQTLLIAAAEGVLDNLECPSCHLLSVSVWFTRPKKNQYRTWFICKNCSFQTRSINAERPVTFSKDRLSEKLQACDSDLLSGMRFPWPDEE